MLCPVCNGDVLAKDPCIEETYCTSCGVVVDEGVSYDTPVHEPESPNHAITSMLIPGKGVAEEVAEIHGIKYKPKTRPLDSVERSYEGAYPYLVSITHILHIPYYAKVFMAGAYRKCARHRATKGRYAAALMLAIAKIACEEIGLVRDFDSLALAYDAKKEEIDSAEHAVREAPEIENTQSDA